MVDSVALTEATRVQLYAARETGAARDEAGEALSSGLRVRNATDDPVDFYRAGALTNRAQDLLVAKNNRGQEISGIETALVGLDSIEALSRQLEGLVSSASGLSNEQRALLADQYDDILGQIDALALDTTFGGVGLISLDAGALGLSGAANFGNFASEEDIDAALNEINAAVATVRNTAREVSNEAASIRIEENFFDNLSETLETGAANLINADINEEAALLLAADIRGDLAITSLGFTTRSEQLVVGLLGDE